MTVLDDGNNNCGLGKVWSLRNQFDAGLVITTNRMFSLSVKFRQSILLWIRSSNNNSSLRVMMMYLKQCITNVSSHYCLLLSTACPSIFGHSGDKLIRDWHSNVWMEQMAVFKCDQEKWFADHMCSQTSMPAFIYTSFCILSHAAS